MCGAFSLVTCLWSPEKLEAATVEVIVTCYPWYLSISLGVLYSASRRWGNQEFAADFFFFGC
jgi:hypothetical protein